MNLISCDGCGLVLDANKVAWPASVPGYEIVADPDNYEWDGDDYVPVIKCHKCGCSVHKPEGVK